MCRVTMHGQCGYYAMIVRLRSQRSPLAHSMTDRSPADLPSPPSLGLPSPAAQLPGLAPFLNGGHRVWFPLSMGLTLVYCGLVLIQAFHGPYVIQDDARQHVFWMQRLVDANLFRQDAIADYFQSVAPAGYTALYRVAAQMGLSPLLFSKLLPVVLGLVSVAYHYGVTVRLFPVPVAGFVSCLLLNQILWMHGDVSSGTPRAFVYALLLSFLYYLLRRSLLPCLISLVLQAAIYPQTVLISAGMILLQMVQWRNGRLSLGCDRRLYWFCGITFGTAVAVMMPYLVDASAYGPVLTLAEVQDRPEFQPGGRAAFFSDDGALTFWLKGDRSGLLPRSERLSPILYGAVLLPLMGWRRLPLHAYVQPAIAVLGQLILVSLGWFGVAHLVLYRLHLPSRYTQHTLRVALAIATAIVLVSLLTALGRWARTGPFVRLQTVGVAWLTLAIALGIALFPWGQPFPRAGYVQGAYPDLYAFFAQHPSDTVIASIAPEADNIPSFSGRSVLTAQEYAIPYHVGYYNAFVDRTLAVLRAQYSTDLEEVRAITEAYSIDVWLLDRGAFRPDYLSTNWVKQYPDATRPIRRSLRQGARPILEQGRIPCTIFENDDLVVIDALCVVEHGTEVIQNAK